MTGLWAWIVTYGGAWVMLLAFGVMAIAFLVVAVAMVEATRRQTTAATTAIGVLLVILALLLALVCGGVAVTAGLLPVLGR